MPEKNHAFDLAIVGGGPGGYIAAIKAAQFGIKTALIEKDKVGGTCLHKGCIPTKTLLYSAKLYHQFKKANQFGIIAENIRINFSQFQRRKELVVKRLFQGIQFLLKKNAVTVFDGTGHFTSSNEIFIVKNGADVAKINAKNIILATGSTPNIPDSITHDKKYVLTSDDVLTLEEIPKSMIIAGGGAIGVEFACLFHTLGTKVTLIEFMDDILPAEDKEISATARNMFIRRGIDIHVNTFLQTVKINNGVHAEVKKNTNNSSPEPESGNMEILKADCLLLALGRDLNLSEIGLEPLTLQFNGKFLQTNEVMETARKGLYAVGDISGTPFLAHKASNEGLLAVSHIAGKRIQPINYQNIPRVVYSFPQIANFGLTETQAEKKGYKIKKGTFPFIANSKAVIEGTNEQGFVKIIAEEKNGKILGVHAFGPEVGEFMWGLSITALLQGTVFDLSRNIFPHPTLSEAFLEASHAVVGKPIHR